MTHHQAKRFRDSVPSWRKSVARDEASDRDARRALRRAQVFWLGLVARSLVVASALSGWWPW